jgi:transglycosylase-like protein with SLT domain
MVEANSARERLTAAVCIVFALAACARANDVATTPTATPPATASAAPIPTSAPDPFTLARSYDASDPQQLARRLNAVEGAIQSGKPVGAGEARPQQAAYRQLVRMPEWRAPAYQLVSEALLPIVHANVEAGAELRLLTPPRTELPPWKIVAPPDADILLAHYRAAEREFRIGWTYLAAIHLVETRLGRIRGDSAAGAKGPMQFLPSTWAAYGEGDITDPRDAIRAAARYLRAHGAPADMPRALFAYNHSQHYVRAIELYAGRMRENANAYRGYYGWQVYYRTTKGDALLYVGWHGG